MAYMLIHIGYHKTGTTWLQNKFFPSHPEFAPAINPASVWHSLIEPNALAFDPDECRSILSGGISADPRVDVISAERLSGNPHSGGYDSKQTADRLYQIFPDAKVLIVLREQTAMLNSLYRQYVRMGGMCPLADYLSPIRDGRMPLFRHEHLQYHRLVHHYQQLFGKDKVCILPYELLCQDSDVFAAKICKIAGVNPQAPDPAPRVIARSSCDFVTAIKSRINRFHGGDSLHPVKPRMPWLTGSLLNLADRLNDIETIQNIDLRYGERCETFAKGLYEKSNSQLQPLVDFDLSKLGYALG
jgi:hypothetical protein